jgi:hypothetical protein
MGVCYLLPGVKEAGDGSYNIFVSIYRSPRVAAKVVGRYVYNIPGGYVESLLERLASEEGIAEVTREELMRPMGKGHLRAYLDVLGICKFLEEKGSLLVSALGCDHVVCLPIGGKEGQVYECMMRSLVDMEDVSIEQGKFGVYKVHNFVESIDLSTFRSRLGYVLSDGAFSVSYWTLGKYLSALGMEGVRTRKLTLRGRSGSDIFIPLEGDLKGAEKSTIC